MSVPVIEINNLNITIKDKKENLNIVEDVTFNIEEQEIVGLVGESGSGKSITALSLNGLLPKAVYISKGSIRFNNTDISKLDEDKFSEIRGKDISMIFQEPMTSLNPVYTVGHQIGECLKLHGKLSKEQAKDEVISIMKKVGLANSERLYNNYPHELSGGMRQRVMIAMAVILKPKLLIADEPTTALDVTIQAQILNLIKRINKEYKMSILFISHDLGVIKRICDRVVVMYAGKIVEEATAEEIFKNPVHPYTKGLLECIPDRSKKGKALSSIRGNIPDLKQRNIKGCNFAKRCIDAKEKCFNQSPGILEISKTHKVRCFCEAETGGIYLENKQYLIEVDNLKKYYPIASKGLFESKKYAKAVDGISFNIKEGEIFGIVGESGSGKSTTGKMLMKLIDTTDGTIKFQGKDITKLKGRELRKLRTEFQIVFQDPYSALNPRKRIGWILEEPLKIQGIKSKLERKKRVLEILKLLGFDENFANKYPHELSGGQRQRIVIGCALMLNPKFIVADEPVSALDVSVQSQILNFMNELHDKFGITFLFISHNLNVVHYMCDRVAVMYLGKLVEIGDVEDIYESPLHPYTEALISAIPDLNSEVKSESEILGGEISSIDQVPSGCPFHTRCPKALEICKNTEPQMRDVSQNGKEHLVRCHRA